MHSHWLAGLVKQSFLKDYPVHVTPSGIDLTIFKSASADLREQYGFHDKKIILGCASIWTLRKGYQDFIALRQLLDSSYQIVMIGLNQKEIRQLPPGILGIQRTESIKELAQWYSVADIFVNPTTQDNFPTTNLEALACGTPVVTYNTGGSPESVDEDTGCVVRKGDVAGLSKAVNKLVVRNKRELNASCRNRAERLYNKDVRYLEYLKLYEKLVNRNSQPANQN